MENIINRYEAIALGKTHFFTGVPCIRGHIAKRYVSTQSCVECLHPTYENNEMMIAKLKRENARKAAALVKEVRKEMSSRMIKIKLKIDKVHINELWHILLMFAQAHSPVLTIEDVMTRSKPKYPGYTYGIYTVRCFSEDEKALRLIETNLRSPEIIRERPLLSHIQQATPTVIDETGYRWYDGDPK